MLETDLAPGPGVHAIKQAQHPQLYMQQPAEIDMSAQHLLQIH